MLVQLDQVLPAAKSRRTMLPVLVFLLVLAWGLMTLVLVEQGSVIQSQRYLIQQLFQDSSQLSALKGKIVWNKNHPAGSLPPASVAPEAVPPATLAPAKPSPAPSTDTARCGNCKSRRPQDRLPQQASDRQDARRSLKFI
jgi:hypothetical protein